VGEVWGVGRALAPKLEQSGIRNAWQLAQQDTAAIRRKYSVVLAKTVMELRGIPCVEDEVADEGAKSISCSRSFSYPVTKLLDLEESVADYAASAAEKLRREGKLAAGANVYLQPFASGRNGGEVAPAVANTVIFDAPTDNTGHIVRALRPKISALFTPGCKYRKTGVIFFGLEAAERKQGELFKNTPAKSPLFQAADKINAKYGRGTTFLLSQGIDKPWQMKRDLLTPAYTTDWDHIPSVK
jgi:DNA polymerase V